MSLTAEQIGVDVGQAYVALAGRLEQLVRTDVRAPDVVIEDACQFAWCCLVDHAARVRAECALSWLTKTAVREALRQIRRERLERSLDAELVSDERGVSITAPQPLPDELAEQRERLALIRGLPKRQQRMLWLHAAGYRYAEIASGTRCTRRTVERQLLRAKRAVRLAAGE